MDNLAPGEYRGPAMLFGWVLLGLLSAPGAACGAGDPSVADYLALPESGQEELVARYRETYRPAFKAAEAALRAASRDTPFLTEGRLKSVRSIQEKLVRPGKDYTCFSQVTDVAGLRIVVPDYAALPFVMGRLRDRFEILERQVRIHQADDSGYRAVHYLVSLEGLVAEIQVHTLRGTLWANASHVLVYKGPYAGLKAVESYLLGLSEAIHLLDSGIHAPLPPVPAGLPRGATVVLEHILEQLTLVERLHPLEPYLFAPRKPHDPDTFLAHPEAPRVTTRELRRLDRALLVRAGIAEDEALLEAVDSGEYFSLGDFADLGYEGRGSRPPPPPP